MKRCPIILMLLVVCVLFILCVLFPWGTMLSMGLFVLGTLGYFEKVFNIHIPSRLCILFLIIYVLLSVANIIYSHHKENSTNQKLHEAEDAATDAQKQLSDLSEYGEVATYTFNGYQQSGITLSPFTPVADWAKGYVKQGEDDYYTSRCDTDAIKHYKDIIEKCPKFPFPYIPLSGCLQIDNDPSWKQYAIKAHSILEITTRIPLHCKDHDGWLKINLLDPTKVKKEKVTIPNQ
ncbi:MAG: hypothetical protein ACLQVJ_17220 [Syntrophobacteraceae bacterium]